MEQKRCISSLTLAELTAELKALGQPGFRAKQIFHWVHQKLVTEFSAMTDQPKTLLAKLEATRQAELLATQAAILDTAAALLKAGGRLVYSTCTIDPAENQQQIAAFLQRHPEFTVCAPDVPLPAGMTAGEHGCLSVPTRTGMDGFFLCVLQKAAATQ